MKEILDITEPGYSEQNFPVPRPFSYIQVLLLVYC